VAVRTSHGRGDFCSCLAIDFVRKTVYLRQASLCTWLEFRTVTADTYLPYPFPCFLCPLPLSLAKTQAESTEIHSFNNVTGLCASC
jgi:hypothetical protein